MFTFALRRQGCLLKVGDRTGITGFPFKPGSENLSCVKPVTCRAAKQVLVIPVKNFI
jgi:hypothetical protein